MFPLAQPCSGPGDSGREEAGESLGPPGSNTADASWLRRNSQSCMGLTLLPTPRQPSRAPDHRSEPTNTRCPETWPVGQSGSVLYLRMRSPFVGSLLFPCIAWGDGRCSAYLTFLSEPLHHVPSFHIFLLRELRELRQRGSEGLVSVMR